MKDILRLTPPSSPPDWFNPEVLGVHAPSAVPSLVPFHLIHAIQHPSEYNARSEKRARSGLDFYNACFLTRNPLPLCAVSEESNASLYLLDHHHTLRFAQAVTELKGKPLPALIFSADQVAMIMGVTPAAVTATLRAWGEETIHAFNQILPHDKVYQPRKVLGVPHSPYSTASPDIKDLINSCDDIHSLNPQTLATWLKSINAPISIVSLGSKEFVWDGVNLAPAN